MPHFARSRASAWFFWSWFHSSEFNCQTELPHFLRGNFLQLRRPRFPRDGSYLGTSRFPAMLFFKTCRFPARFPPGAWRIVRISHRGTPLMAKNPANSPFSYTVANLVPQTSHCGPVDSDRPSRYRMPPASPFIERVPFARNRLSVALARTKCGVKLGIEGTAGRHG